MGFFSSIFKKKTAESVFNDSYHEMLEITKNSPLSHNAEFELLPAMFSGFLFVLEENPDLNYDLMQSKIADEIKRISPNIDEDLFGERISVYEFEEYKKENWIIFGDGYLQNFWLLGNDSNCAYQDGLTRCYRCLCDILYNPACIDNENGVHDPSLLIGSYGALSFKTKVAEPLFNAFMYSFIDKIFKVMKKENK